MATLNPWINFNGNAEEAFTFYASVFNSKIAKIVRFKDIASADIPVSDVDVEKIMMIVLPIDSNSMLIGNDVPSFMGTVSEKENRSKISVSAESKEEADSLFTALSVGAAIDGPIGISPWNTYMGTLRDKYGIEWIIEFH